MYGRDQIDQVRSSTDIVEVIRDYVPSLRASGRSVKGLCPFHSEKTPSFHVHADKGLFKCFGCGESGDVFKFLEKIEQVSFLDALKTLADRSGVVLRDDRRSEKPEPEGIREKLYRVLDAASRIYEEALWDERQGEVAREYLTSRGVREGTAQNFRIGAAASGGSPAFETLVKRGFAIELCQQAGLAARSSGGRYYDPMFGRLIFPIFDSFGHVIGFGGRVLPSTEKGIPGLGPDEGEAGGGPKYLNSPETPVFSKGKALYGLYQGKKNILESRRVVILEGYMDVVGVQQAGVGNAVATLGTALTRDHAKLLKRYADEVVSFFDPDEAGKAAAMRSLEPMLQEDFFPRVVVTGETADPDEIVLQKGKVFFDELVASAPDFVDYILGQTGGATLGLQQRSQLAKQLVALIAQSPNEILKSEWVGRVAKALGLHSESLEQERKKAAAAIRRQTEPDEPKSPARFAPRPRTTVPPVEEEYIHLLLSTPDVWTARGLAPQDFVQERHRRLMGFLDAQLQNTGKVSVPALCEEMPAEDREWLISLSLEERETAEPLERFHRLVKDIRRMRDRERLQRLSVKVAAGAMSEAERAEYLDLLKQIKGSGRAVAVEEFASDMLTKEG